MSEKKQPTFKRDVDTETLVAFLLKRHETAPGSTITYEELSGIISRKVNNGARHILSSARRVLSREHNILMTCIATVGLKFVEENSEVLGIADSHQKRVRRANRNTLHIVKHVDMTDATPDEKARALAVQSIVGAIDLCTKTSSRNKVKELCASTGAAVPVGKSLELFRE